MILITPSLASVDSKQIGGLLMIHTLVLLTLRHRVSHHPESRDKNLGYFRAKEKILDLSS